MTLTNFMMSSETRDKLRRQSNFVENLVLGKMYKINEIQCCLEPIDKDGKDRRAMMFYLDEVGNKYSFHRLDGEQIGNARYGGFTSPEQ